VTVAVDQTQDKPSVECYSPVMQNRPSEPSLGNQNFLLSFGIAYAALERRLRGRWVVGGALS
jgi:hypothetical protein